MWTIVRAMPIRVVANFLFITMAFLVVGITRAASTSTAANVRELTTDIFLSFKKILKDYIYALFFLHRISYISSHGSLVSSPTRCSNIFYPKLSYPIEDEIVSTTTWVIFTRRKHIKQQICLKPWQLNNEKVCNPKLVNRRIEYLLEGLEFNRRFAQGVYLGVAPVEPSKKPKKILRRKLITQPDESKLKQGVEYALVMRRLLAAYPYTTTDIASRMTVGYVFDSVVGVK